MREYSFLIHGQEVMVKRYPPGQSSKDEDWEDEPEDLENLFNVEEPAVKEIDNSKWYEPTWRDAYEYYEEKQEEDGENPEGI